MTLQDAVDAFLDHHDLARSTRRVYRASLASLVAGLGPATAVGELSGPMLAGWFRGRYPTAAPATWNRELATLRVAVRWWGHRGWLAADPTDALERRRERVDRTRALTRGQLERLFARRDLPLRERTLWRLLYETAARANELLALNVEDRLSYRRAAELFHARTGWTLHRLRHSALTHAAEDGTNLPLLLARSRHASVRSLERYARPRTRGGCPPPRRDRPGTPTPVTHQSLRRGPLPCR